MGHRPPPTPTRSTYLELVVRDYVTSDQAFEEFDARVNHLFAEGVADRLFGVIPGGTRPAKPAEPTWRET